MRSEHSSHEDIYEEIEAEWAMGAVPMSPVAPMDPRHPHFGKDPSTLDLHRFNKTSAPLVESGHSGSLAASGIMASRRSRVIDPAAHAALGASRRSMGTHLRSGTTVGIQRDIRDIVMEHKARKKRRVPMWVILASVISLQVLIAVAINWYLIWSGSNDSLIEMSELVVTTQVGKIEDASVSLLEETSRLLQDTMTNFATESLTLDDKLGQRKHYWPQISSHSTLSFVYTGTEADGHFLGYGRRTTGELIYLQHPEQPGNSTRVQFNVDSKGNPTTVIQGTTYDARLRPWYQEAKNETSTVWTSVYPFSSTPELGITVASPMYNGTTLVGVAAVDLLLNSLTAFLQRQDLGKTGVAVIIEPDLEGWIVASNRPLDIRGEKISILTVEDELLREIGQYMMDEFGSFNGVAARQGDTFDGVRGRTLISTSAIEGLSTRGISWKLAVAVDRDEYFADIDHANKVTAGVAVAVLVGSVLVSALVAYCLVRPLKRLKSDMEHVTNELAFDDESSERIYTKELGQMSDAYNRLKKGLRNFRKFVPEEIVNQLVKNKGDAVLAVEQIEASIFFSDIEGFTSISERVSPSLLILILERYLDEMATIIMDRKGLVADYIGDAIFAFYGSPLVPVQNHAMACCEAALLQQEKMEELNGLWQEEDLPVLKIRMGIHTGNVLCGNTGSQKRMKYSLLGDAANLASRLENLNKKYGTYLMISGDTYERVHSTYLCRPLDLVAVKGREASTRIYELVTWVDLATPKQRQFASLCTGVLDRFLDRDFEAALALIEKAEPLRPDDLSLQYLRARCEAFQVNPPPEDWSGATVMDEK